MKKLLLLLAMLCACVFASAQNEDVEKAYTLAFEKDHTEFKDMVTTMRLWKRMGKIYTGTYDEKTAFTASKENKEKGYTVYANNYTVDIYPNSRPSQSDLKRPLGSFGTPGEFKPITLCVLPETDQSSITVSVSELKGPAESIPAENVSVRHVKYEYVPIGVQWFVKGRYLVKGPADGFAGIPRMFWITVKIPETAAPGVYKGEVTVMAGKSPTKLPVSVEVFPFKFAEWEEHHTYWMWYYNSYPASPEIDNAMQNLRDHGMNCFDSADPFPVKYSGGKVSVDFSTADRIVPLLKKYGFTSWMFDSGIQGTLCELTGKQPWSPAHRAALKQFGEIVAAKAKAGNWPKLIFTFDEPREDSEPGKMRGWIDMKNTFEILGEAGIITNPSWAGPGGFKRKDDPSKMADYTELISIPYYNTTHAGFPPTQKIIEKVHSLKKPLLLYNCGANRYAFGFLTWQEGAYGNSQFWWGAAKYGCPTTEYAASSCAVYGKDGIIDTTNWEHIREGVYDYRYIMTLEKAIAANKNPGSAEVNAAKAVLAEIKNYKISSGKGTGYEADFLEEAMKNFKGADKMDVLRYKMGQAIISLQGK